MSLPLIAMTDAEMELAAARAAVRRPDQHEPAALMRACDLLVSRGDWLDAQAGVALRRRLVAEARVAAQARAEAAAVAEAAARARMEERVWARLVEEARHGNGSQGDGSLEAEDAAWAAWRRRVRVENAVGALALLVMLAGGLWGLEGLGWLP